MVGVSNFNPQRGCCVRRFPPWPRTYLPAPAQSFEKGRSMDTELTGETKLPKPGDDLDAPIPWTRIKRASIWAAIIFGVSFAGGLVAARPMHLAELVTASAGSLWMAGTVTVGYLTGKLHR